MEGVGQVKVHPIWEGEGTVKLVIASTNEYDPEPDQELLDTIQDDIDPSDDPGKGLGLAPIGHTVTVVGAEAAEVIVEMEITLVSGATIGQAQSAVPVVVQDYCASLVEKWSSTGENGLMILPSVISYKVLDDPTCSTIVNSIESLRIKANGTWASPWANVTLGVDQVPVAGELQITET